METLYVNDSRRGRALAGKTKKAGRGMGLGRRFNRSWSCDIGRTNKVCRFSQDRPAVSVVRTTNGGGSVFAMRDADGFGAFQKTVETAKTPRRQEEVFLSAKIAKEDRVIIQSFILCPLCSLRAL